MKIAALYIYIAVQLNVIRRNKVPSRQANRSRIQGDNVYSLITISDETFVFRPIYIYIQRGFTVYIYKLPQGRE